MSVTKRNVTPAEYQLYRYEHGANVGKPIILPGSFKIVGDKLVVAGRKPDGSVIPRAISDSEELALLKRRFSKRAINALYPGSNPKLPATFAEVGVSDDGEVKSDEQQTDVEVINADGIEVVQIASSGAPMAPRSAGTSNPRGPAPDPQSTERLAGAPTEFIESLTKGPLSDDGGRPTD